MLSSISRALSTTTAELLTITEQPLAFLLASSAGPPLAVG